MNGLPGEQVSRERHGEQVSRARHGKQLLLQ